jgi:histidine ammonia-lyase
MTVLLDGHALTLDEVLRVARAGESIALAPVALQRMAATRAVVESALARGEGVYGLTTGVAERKLARVDPAEAAAFNRSMLLAHRMGQGPTAAPEIVRATTLRLTNLLAGGTTGVRPALAEVLVGALNADQMPAVRSLGSVGQGDLPQLADLAVGLVEDAGFELAAGEGLALIGNNAFATGSAALAFADACTLLDALDAAAALSFEGMRANLSVLHPAVAEARPFPGVRDSIDRLRWLLEGSQLWEPGAARSLQDPLTFRTVPQLHGAARDAFAFASGQLGIELNAAQGNPLVVPGGEIVSVGNFDSQPLATALDLVRIALAPVLSASAERGIKLLTPGQSGLPAGLVAREGTAEDGWAEFGVPAQSLAAEARLLAAPVSFELVSTMKAGGIEDRTTLAPLAARRLAEMARLGARVTAIELSIAARAVDLRGEVRLGRGTERIHASVRSAIPPTADGDPPAQDLEPLVTLVGSGDMLTGVAAAI